MKKVLVIICMYGFIDGAVGCMDNRKHVDCTLGCFDYKNYHYVECNCRCERYAHAMNRGQCRHCLHFRVSSSISILHDKKGNN